MKIDVLFCHGHIGAGPIHKLTDLQEECKLHLAKLYFSFLSPTYSHANVHEDYQRNVKSLVMTNISINFPHKFPDCDHHFEGRLTISIFLSFSSIFNSFVSQVWLELALGKRRIKYFFQKNKQKLKSNLYLKKLIIAQQQRQKSKMLQDVQSIKNITNSLKFASIKQLFEDNIERNNRIQLPFHFKAMILGGVLERIKVLKSGAQSNQIRRVLCKWRVNCSNTWQRKSIDKLVTSGPIRMENFFYRLKLFAFKQIDNKKIGFGHQRGKYPHGIHEIQTEIKSISPVLSKNSFKSKPSSPKVRNDSPGGGVSLSDIFTPDLGDHRQLHELDTYINLFQTSVNEEKSKLQIAFNILQKFMMLKQFQSMSLSFRMILHQSLEQNFEEQLLKAKRNLQLAENSLILQNRLQKMDEDHQQQYQNLQKITNELQYLRQKLLLSKTKDLVKGLKKHIYPPLEDTFNILKQNLATLTHEECNYAKKYEIQQICISDTSLSIGPSYQNLQSMSALTTKRRILQKRNDIKFANNDQFYYDIQ